MEIWKPILGYEGKYSVSSHGRVRNNLTGHTRRGCRTRSGYLHLSLSHNKDVKYVYVHRLVAKCFLEQADGRMEVNHKDGNKWNNRADNLEWVTPADNMKHALETGLCSPYGNDRKPIIATNIDTGAERYFASIRDAKSFFGTSHVGDVLKGLRKQAKGYTFRYANGGDAHAG